MNVRVDASEGDKHGMITVHLQISPYHVERVFWLECDILVPDDIAIPQATATTVSVERVSERERDRERQSDRVTE